MFKKTKVVKYKIIFTKQAQKDAKKLQKSLLKEAATKILDLLAQNPFQNPPSYEALLGELKGSYSRRLNSQHRIVYEVNKQDRLVKIIRMWTHYE